METATIEDVKPTEESSTSVAPESAISEDATSESSTETTTSQTQDPVDEAIKAVVDKATDSSKVEEEVEKKETLEIEEPSKVEEKGPIPYERFAEINEQKKTFESQVQQYEPLAKAQQSIVDYCQRNQIEPDDFSKWLEIAALVKNDPAKAFEVLAPEFEKLQSFRGDKLSPELQAAVDNGEISLAYAKKQAEMENKLKWTQQATQRSKEQEQQRLAQQYQTQMTNSLVTWMETKSKAIPDLKPAGQGEADGVYELFLNKFTVEAAKANIQNTEDLLRFADKTLDSVLKTIGRFKPKASVQKVLKTSQTNTPPQNEATTNVDEAIKAAARKHGMVV